MTLFANSQESGNRQGFSAFVYRQRRLICLSVFLCWAAVFFLLANRASLQSSASSRFMFSLGGLWLGFAVGIALAWVLEKADARFRVQEHSGDLLSFRVLVSLPHLHIPGEQSRRAVLHTTELCVISAMLLLILAGNIYLFVRW